jgi:putative lipase involved disintegration of autophagic bodies
LDKILLKSELYYDYAANIYMDVADRYPGATIWLTGHSLGGAIATLLGQTFGVPAVSFESPGDRLAAQRLHLPRGPGAADMPIWHFGHTADPIFIGVCTVSLFPPPFFSLLLM